LYYTASRDVNGDIIVKMANLLPTMQTVVLEFEGMSEAKGTAFIMEGYSLDAVNSFEKPRFVIPKEHDVIVQNGKLNVEMPSKSFRVYRIQK
jgi:alpha-L-arabinofuranosidase